ncbi:MAG: hypothetical protein PUH88_00535 [Lachnospiraceae bacterium]|nr:hypothetical protein [Lachnospiraceae bacterium]
MKYQSYHSKAHHTAEAYDPIQIPEKSPIIPKSHLEKMDFLSTLVYAADQGTCKPETKTGVQTETIKSGAAVSFTDSSSGSSSGSSSSSKVKVSALKIEGASKKLLTGKKMTLKAVATPSNAADKSVTWSSKNMLQ